MQLVYLSTRPALLRETLEHVDRLMPFIESVAICCPDGQSSLAGAMADTVLTDSELVPGGLPSDHQARNWLLRSKLATHPAIADVFVMSDDDSRPLRMIEPSTFIENERYNSYYFHDLSSWRHDATDFDRGQHATYQILSFHELDTLAYASHMPQVIDKELWRSAVERFEAISERWPLCEWSTYANHARAEAPERFNRPQPYRTLAWPDLPGRWPLLIRPAAYLFENFHPELYGPGQLFEGLGTTVDVEQADELALEKILRWYRLELAAERMDSAASAVAHPSRPTLRNRMGRGARRWAQRNLAALTAAERSDLARLRGDLDRIVASLADVLPESSDERTPSFGERSAPRRLL